MLPLQLTVRKYIKELNYCEAILLSGEVVAFDPFVSCAIELSDSDYQAGKGEDIVGETFILADFSVQPWFAHDPEYQYMVIPNEDGIFKEAKQNERFA